MPLRDRCCGLTIRFKSVAVLLLNVTVFFQHDLVVCIHFSMGVGSSCMISELLASDSFVLKLNVFQLVHKLDCISAPYNLRCGGEREFKGEILVKRLCVEDAAACQNLVIKIDFVFHCVDTLKAVFRIHPKRSPCRQNWSESCTT